MNGWDSKTPYAFDEAVSHNGKTYKALKGHQGSEPPSYFWKEEGVSEPKKENNGKASAYDKYTPYKTGDIIEHDGLRLEALSPSLGASPSNNNVWKTIGSEEKPIATITKHKDNPAFPVDDYVESYVYTAGDVVKHKGKLYRAEHPTQGTNPEDNKVWHTVLEPKKLETHQKEEQVITRAKEATHLIVHEHGHDGRDGLDGLQGEKGDTGPKGDKGEKGDKGDTGEVGLRGPKGDKGDTGERGPEGSPGKDGKAGYEVAWARRLRLKNVGAGHSVISASDAHAANLKGLVAGSNVTITESSTDITIASTGGGGGGSIPQGLFSIIG